MADVNNRPIVPPPGSEKSRDIPFGIGVIPRPVDGVILRIDRLLDVDDQQGGMGKLQHHRNSRSNG